MKIKRFLFGIILVLFSASLSAQSKYVQRVQKQLVKNDTAKALKKLNKYINKHPEDAQLFLQRARLKIERGDLDPAMLDLNSYSSIVQEADEAAFLKGIIRYKQGDHPGAIAHFSNYTKANKDERGWTYLGLSHMRQQHYPVAINAFRKSLEYNPKQPIVLYNAGLSAFYYDDFSLADSFFQAAIELEPSDSDYRIALANVLLKQEDFIEGNKVLREIEKGDKNFLTALYNIGINYYHLDERSLACDYWKQAKKAGNTNAENAIARYCGKKSGKVKKW